MRIIPAVRVFCRNMARDGNLESLATFARPGATRMKEIPTVSWAMPRRVLRMAPFATMLLFAVATGSTEVPRQGIVRPFSEVKFAADDDVKCLAGVVEKGDPASGPSTFILKAPAGCVVAPHYHTAEEQLMVVRGKVLTGMEGMSEVVLGSGGFAMMPGKAVHWFTCTSQDSCVMFVTFDRTYDIVWVKPKK
jgi:quercetin dioxygenase-like cupin family protein